MMIQFTHFYINEGVVSGLVGSFVSQQVKGLGSKIFLSEFAEAWVNTIFWWQSRY